MKRVTLEMPKEIAEELLAYLETGGCDQIDGLIPVLKEAIDEAN